MRALPLVLLLGVPLAACDLQPETTIVAVERTRGDLIDGAREAIAVGDRAAATRLLDLQLTRLDRRVLTLTEASVVGRLTATDGERLGIVDSAAAAARADLDALSSAPEWITAARALADRIEAIERGLDRITVEAPKNI